MKKYPFNFVITIFSGGILFFGYTLKIAEAPLNRVVNDMDHSNFVNCCWESILVMTTVGYGDIYPRTIMGRIVIFVCSIYGVTVVSLMVVTITNSLEMSESEVKAFLVLERLKINESLRTHASHLVGVVGKLKKAEKLNKKNRISLVSRMAKHTTQFKTLRQRYNNIQDENMKENFERQLNIIQKEIGLTKEKLSDLLFAMNGGYQGKMFRGQAKMMKSFKSMKTNDKFAFGRCSINKV
jgi:hypothetical protein